METRDLQPVPGIVLDASITVCWLLPDEADSRADTAWDRSQTSIAVVPQLWHTEVRNALFQAERRRRSPPAQTEASFQRLNTIAVVTDTTPDYNAVLSLARLHDLSVYDALYLELAIRSTLELATLESRLGQAAAREGLLMTGS